MKLKRMGTVSKEKCKRSYENHCTLTTINLERWMFTDNGWFEIIDKIKRGYRIEISKDCEKCSITIPIHEKHYCHVEELIK